MTLGSPTHGPLRRGLPRPLVRPGGRPLGSAALVSLLGLCGCSPSAGPAQVVVDPATTYQTILSWEATAQVGDDDYPREFVDRYRAQAISFAVDSLGLNGLRLTLKSGVESERDLSPDFLAGRVTRAEWRRTWYASLNDDADPHSIDPAGFQFTWLDHVIENVVLPMRERLEARNEELFLNLNYVDFEVSPFEHLENSEEYAELVLATFLHMDREFGFVPDAVEVLLEPDVGQLWPAHAVAAGLVAAGERLREHGFRPLFIAPSTADMAAAVEYFDSMIDADPRVLEHLSVLSYHRYRSVSDEALREIGSRVDQHGVRSAMLEHIGSGHENLHADLEVGLTSMWQQFVIAWPGPDDNGGAYLRVLEPESDDPRVVFGSRSRLLAPYFHSARRGAVRIGADSDNERVEPLAFVNPDSTYAVVVKATGSTELTVLGLPAGSYSGVYATASGDRGVVGPVETDGSTPLTASLPGPGVLSLRATPPR